MKRDTKHVQLNTQESSLVLKKKLQSSVESLGNIYQSNFTHVTHTNTILKQFNATIRE